MFKASRDIVGHCCDAWNTLIDQLRNRSRGRSLSTQAMLLFHPISNLLPAAALLNIDRTSNRQQLSTSIRITGVKEIAMVRDREIAIRKTIRR